jgi:hypothetical protein
MGGKETVGRLLELDPGARVIVTSGYSEDPVLTHYKDYGFVGMLGKPFQLFQIGKTLFDVLKKNG